MAKICKHWQVSRALLFCFGLVTFASGQQSSNPPRIISAPEIADRYTQTATLVQRATTNAKEDPRVREIRADMVQVSSGIDEFVEFFRNQKVLSANLWQGADLLQTWRAAAARLSQQATYLHRRAGDLEQDRAALASANDLWSRTLQAAVTNDLPAEVQTRVSSLVDSLSKAQRSTSERRSSVLALQSQLAEQQFKADGIIEQILSATREQRRALVSPDSAPIWEELAPGHQYTIEAPSFAFSSKAQEVHRLYLIDLLTSLTLFLILVVTVWLLLRRLKPRATAWLANGDSNIRTLGFVVTRPVSSAVFLAVTIEILLLRDSVPFMVGIAVIALIVPSLRLLPELTAKGLSRAFYVLAVLILALDLIKLVPRNSIAYRLTWMALQFAILLASFWLLPILRRRNTTGFWAYLMRVFTGLAMFVAACAMLANAIGTVHLSLLLTQLVLYSYYAAVTIRGTVLILSGMVITALQAPRLSTVEFASHHRAELERQAMRVLNVAGTAAFFASVLYLTTLLDPFRSNLYYFLGTRFSVGAISISLQNILAFALTVLVALVSSSVIRVALELSAYRHLKLSIGQKETYSKLLHYVILFFGFLVAFGAAGVELSKIAILAGGLSVGVGLGLQNVVNNFVSGLILLFERPLQVGDIVSIGSVDGQVKNIGIRASTIRNGDGADVIVPNAKLISGDLTNWTHTDSVRRVSITIMTGLDVQPNRIVDVLTEVAKLQEQVLSSPAPAALLSGFNGNSLEFTLGFWCDATLGGTISSDLRARMVEAFREAGIAVPSFQQNLQIKMAQ